MQRSSFSYLFIPDTGAIEGCGSTDVEKQGMFGPYTMRVQLEYVLDRHDRLYVEIGFRRYLFHSVGRETLAERLAWIAKQSKYDLDPYRTRLKALRRGEGKWHNASYLFVPENGSFLGHGVVERKMPDHKGIVEFAFVYDCLDNLRIVIGKTHYLFPNTKREKLEDTLNWFASLPDEDRVPYEMDLKAFET